MKMLKILHIKINKQQYKHLRPHRKMKFNLFQLIL